jgi:hypothetical protein
VTNNVARTSGPTESHAVRRTRFRSITSIRWLAEVQASFRISELCAGRTIGWKPSASWARGGGNNGFRRQVSHRGRGDATTPATILAVRLWYDFSRAGCGPGPPFNL